MSTLTTNYSRVTEAAKWPGNPVAISIACSRRGATDFGPGVEVVLEERPRHADGSHGDWRHVRTFREEFSGTVPLTVGEFRIHCSQSDSHERTWSIDVRGDDRQAVDLVWFDEAADRFRRLREQGLDPEPEAGLNPAA